MGHPNVRPREQEYVVPEARLHVVFHLGEIEIGSVSALYEFFGVAIEVDREVEDECGQGGLSTVIHGLSRCPPRGL